MDARSLTALSRVCWFQSLVSIPQMTQRYLLLLDFSGGRIGFTLKFEASSSCALNAREGCQVFMPSDIKRSLDTMRARRIFPDGGPIDVAAGITQVCNLGEGELQGSVLMNELSHAVSDEPDGRNKTHSKSGRRRISTFTRHGFALEAIFAGIRLAIGMNRTCMAWLAENAG